MEQHRKQLYTCSDGVYRTLDDMEWLTELRKKVSVICEYNPENRKWKKGRLKRTFMGLGPPRVYFPSTFTGRVWVE